jgi:hypothetical protein
MGTNKLETPTNRKISNNPSPGESSSGRNGPFQTRTRHKDPAKDRKNPSMAVATKRPTVLTQKNTTPV